MSEHAFRLTGLVLMLGGFILWAYGFVYSSFWYANPGASILEPARVWVSGFTRQQVPPGAVEEVVGLAAALTGIVLQVMPYYGKR